MNKLEKLEIISDKDVWLNLRSLRNQFAHEYGDDAKNVNVLNELYKKQSILQNFYSNIEKYLADKIK